MEYSRYALFRNNRGMNDSQVAKAAGIGTSTISDWKAGRSVPKQDKLRRIAEVLKVEYSEFIGSTAQNSIDVIERNMRNLDSAALDRIIKYAEYLKTLQRGE